MTMSGRVTSTARANSTGSATFPTTSKPTSVRRRASPSRKSSSSSAITTRKGSPHGCAGDRRTRTRSETLPSSAPTRSSIRTRLTGPGPSTSTSITRRSSDTLALTTAFVALPRERRLRDREIRRRFDPWIESFDRHRADVGPGWALPRQARRPRPRGPRPARSGRSRGRPREGRQAPRAARHRPVPGRRGQRCTPSPSPRRRRARPTAIDR